MPLNFPNDNQLTAEAMNNPQPGDYFTEFLVFWVFVVARTGDRVTTIEANAPCTLPNDGVMKEQTVETFKRRFSYLNAEGYFIQFVSHNHPDCQSWANAKCCCQYPMADPHFFCSMCGKPIPSAKG